MSLSSIGSAGKAVVEKDDENSLIHTHTCIYSTEMYAFIVVIFRAIRHIVGKEKEYEWKVVRSKKREQFFFVSKLLEKISVRKENQVKRQKRRKFCK